jgi:transcriptional antiterminator NusG
MWYVVQVLNGAGEQKICDECRKAIPESIAPTLFVPMYICMRRYQGEWHREQKVLFPGYFFLDTEEPEKVENALAVLSRMVQPVRVGNAFVPIYEKEQGFLQDMMNSRHIVEMSVGNMVNGDFDIYQGPLQRKASYIRKVDRHKRTGEIEVSLLGQPRRVKVGLEIVQKVETGVK